MATATANANAPAKTDQQPSGLAIKADPRSLQFKALFENDKFQASLRQTLPKHVDPKRLIRVTLSAFQTAPKLLECTPESVLLSLMRAASMGLEPDGGPLGQGYLVPFYNGKNRRMECQFIPGFRGLVKLARNSGEVADVWAEVAYAKDYFAYELGVNPTLKHTRNDDTDDPGELKYAYAVARFRDGERKFVVMNKREVEGIRAKSASKTREGDIVGPWKDWPAEMWKKTAVRRLCKMLPLSVEVQTQISHDHDDSPGVDVQLPDMLSLPGMDSGSVVDEAEQAPEFAEKFADCKTAVDANEVYKDLVSDDPTLGEQYAAARDWKLKEFE